MKEDEREKLKDLFICPECKQKAYFRKKRKDGRSACFCAHHLADCDNKTKSGELSEYDNPIEENKLIARDDYFKLEKKDYLKNIWSLKTSAIDDNDDNDDDKSTNKKKINVTHNKNPEKEIIIKKSLPKILNLCTNKIIDQQNFMIEIDGLPIHIRDSVYNIRNINETHCNKKRLFWGYVVSASRVWLNFSRDYKNDPSIQIPPEFQDELWERLKIIPSQWRSPVPVIIEGILRKAHSTGKYFILFTNFENIYIDLKRFKRAYKSFVN